MKAKHFQKGPKWTEDPLKWYFRREDWPTDGCHGIILALGEDHQSLPLCVFLGKVLSPISNLCDVICL